MADPRRSARCDAHKETLEKDAPVFAPGKTDPATTSWETADGKTFL